MHIIKLVKKLIVFIFSLFTYSFLAVPAFAVEVNINPCSSVTNAISTALCKLGGTNGANIGQTIGNIVIFMIVVAVLIAVLWLIYGGIKWIMSRGEKTEVEAARNHIVAAITGLIVVFLAIFIIAIILNLFGLNPGNLKVPQIAP